MRWPIQFQLLVPTLSVVVLAIALTTGVSAYFSVVRARQSQEDSLRRMVATLAEAPFPLTESVLQQMRGLSGADFVFFDRGESIQASTRHLNDLELVHLLAIPISYTNAARSAGWATSPTVSLGDRTYLSQRVAMAARDPLSQAGSLVILYPQDLWWGIVRQAAYPAILVGAAAVAAVILITTLLAHHVVQPLHHLRQRAAAIARGNFQPVAIAKRNDEIRDLAISINHMAEQLGQYENQIRRHEQLRTLGQLGAGMAHQLRNAATGGRMATELHRRECNSGQSSETLDVALRQMKLMESYLQRFLAAGQMRPFTLENISLSNVVAGAVDIVRPTCVHAGVELVFQEPATPLWINGDSDALRQMILNLTLNAIEATQERQKSRQVQINRSPELHPDQNRMTANASTDGSQSTSSRIMIDVETLGQDRAALRIRDSGSGPAANIADQLFEPFVTNKTEGTGLGLYVARQVAEAHQGEIQWQHTDGETCFSVLLPRIPNPHPPQILNP
jgi:signal transduction histidine kinase